MKLRKPSHHRELTELDPQGNDLAEKIAAAIFSRRRMKEAFSSNLEVPQEFRPLVRSLIARPKRSQKFGS